MIVTHQDKTVTGDTAVFDTRANLITMRGGVVLTQCTNVLRGDRLIVDMTNRRVARWKPTTAGCRACSTRIPNVRRHRVCRMLPAQRGRK